MKVLVVWWVIAVLTIIAEIVDEDDFVDEILRTAIEHAAKSKQELTAEKWSLSGNA